MQSIYDLLMRQPSKEESKINQGAFTVDELKDMIVNRINENAESLQVLSQKVWYHSLARWQENFISFLQIQIYLKGIN